MKKNIHSICIYLFIHLFDKYLLSTYYVLDALPVLMIQQQQKRIPPTEGFV